MSEQKVRLLEVNLNQARTLISVQQSKIARQRDDNAAMRDRVSNLMSDKRELTKTINELREKQNES